VKSAPMRLNIRLIDRAARGLSKSTLISFIGSLWQDIVVNNGSHLMVHHNHWIELTSDFLQCCDATVTAAPHNFIYRSLASCPFLHICVKHTKFVDEAKGCCRNLPTYYATDWPQPLLSNRLALITFVYRERVLRHFFGWAG
jgi:hypothetical protein